MFLAVWALTWVLEAAVSCPPGNDDLCGGNRAHLITAQICQRSPILCSAYISWSFMCTDHCTSWIFLGSTRVATGWYDYGGKYGKWRPTDATGQQKPQPPLSFPSQSKCWQILCQRSSNPFSSQAASETQIFTSRQWTWTNKSYVVLRKPMS